MARIVGNDGAVTYGAHGIVVNSWSMTISRVVSDVTGFGDSVRTKLGGVSEITGSLTGFLDSDSNPDFTGEVLDNNSAGDVITLTALGDPDRNWSGTAIVSNVSVSTSKTGDCTVSLDFAFTGDVDESWS